MLTFGANKRGQGLVEYALILVLVAIVVIVALSLLGPAVGNVFSQGPAQDAFAQRGDGRATLHDPALLQVDPEGTAEAP